MVENDLFDELFPPAKSRLENCVSHSKLKAQDAKRKPRKKTPKKDLEGAVLRECLVWLRVQGFYAERRNTGAIKIDNSFFRFGSPGAADIFAVINGRHIEIECKRRSGGVLSASQKEFRELMKNSGIPYFVVHSVEELQEKLSFCA